MLERSIFSLLHALAGCGRRCATLFLRCICPREGHARQTVRSQRRQSASVAGHCHCPCQCASWDVLGDPSCLLSAHSRCGSRCERTMKLASPSFTGVLRCSPCCTQSHCVDEQRGTGRHVSRADHLRSLKRMRYSARASAWFPAATRRSSHGYRY